MKKTSRLTVDMEEDEHKCLKLACTELGLSMREFMVRAAFEKIEALEDEWLAEKAREVLKRIDAGEEKMVSWKESKKRLS